MKFAQDSIDDGNVITAYGDDSVCVNKRILTSSLVITRNSLVDDWGVASIDVIETSHMEVILDHGPELVVIGTGKVLTFPPAETYAVLIRQGIGVEFMDTGAACRTYNILVSEGRDVVAGLIL